MKAEKREGLLEWSNISFGHMLKLEHYKEELGGIVSAFLERKDILLSNLMDQGTLIILIKVYSREVSLVKINEIIGSIFEYLDEESQIEVEIAHDTEEDDALREYFHLTLIEV